MSFEYASFVNRNPAYALKNWRAQSRVRKNMLQVRKANPYCAWCGRTDTLQVHHITPVQVDPYKAHVKSNMKVLCRKHHLEVGHNGNFRTRYEDNLEAVLLSSRVARVKD